MTTNYEHKRMIQNWGGTKSRLDQSRWKGEFDLPSIKQMKMDYNDDKSQS